MKTRHGGAPSAAIKNNRRLFAGVVSRYVFNSPLFWTDELAKPCPVAPFYGLMWWLNTDRRQFAAASEKSYFALGWGSHIVWIDPDNDLVTVLRWIDRKQAPGFVERLLGAINK